MGNYEILKLEKEQYDFLVIATSCKNPLSYIEEIGDKIEISQAKIIFDLTLINGVKNNRYVVCDYNKNNNKLPSCYLLKELPESIKKLSHNYFLEHTDIVQNSVIPSSLKFLIKNGMII